MAGEIEAAIGAGLGEAATGLVIEPDFDGDFAELMRGLAGAALAHSFEASRVRIRQFVRADAHGALEWAAAARRGE